MTYSENEARALVVRSGHLLPTLFQTEKALDPIAVRQDSLEESRQHLPGKNRFAFQRNGLGFVVHRIVGIFTGSPLKSATT